ncbi:hypothetical protein GCM10010149_55960 [Nonomuraea roseoviolacea subsp. roseoviolacea]|uniref:Secreted protein n=1 Tax=Nonomuraea roseoviolacea subsp. carminata TaxID=160689 RepID=A0ABT1K1N5_9ACTN|nr:hypothetical protein [Nonomuraea roseoviolacea]MCP2347913.1 hypothetical protein [Nonomuraea roseoviolacea subsp. carminata]
MKRASIATVTGLILTAGLLGQGAAGASAADTSGPANVAAATTAAPKPPKGARAVVQVSPNPTTRRGQEITITGNCGGGQKLKEVIGGVTQRPVLTNIRIIDDNPEGFVAKATLAREVGNGVGPIMVSCGDEMGVTLLVTHV